MKDLDNYLDDWMYVIAEMLGAKCPDGYECFWKKYFYRHVVDRD